jgi:8-oxo-dGTP pyrophosphatase MutT (NUDIX family)
MIPLVVGPLLAALLLDSVVAAPREPDDDLDDPDDEPDGDSERMHDGHWGRRAAGILFTDRRRVLLLLRSDRVLDPGVWGIPGGAVSVSDDLQRGALREVREEIGGIPANAYPYDRVVLHAQDGTAFTFTTFVWGVPRDDAEAFEPVLNWESDDWGWFSQEDLLDLELHPGVRYALLERYDSLFDEPDERVRRELAAGVSRTFTLARGDERDRVLVWVDVGKLDAAWRASSGDFYIGPGGTGAAIGDRYADFGDFVATGRAIEASRVSYTAWNDGVTFGDGRHRFAWLRDHGERAVALAVPREQVDLFIERYGPDLPVRRRR